MNKIPETRPLKKSKKEEEINSLDNNNNNNNKNTDKEENKEKEGKNECVICLDQFKEFIEFLPCKHKCVCSNCFLKVEVFKTSQLKFSQSLQICPICRSFIKYSYCVEPKIVYKEVCSMEGAQKFFKFLKNYSIAISSRNAEIQIEQIVETICTSYRNLFDEYKRPCLISAEQSENLLTLFNSKDFGSQTFKIKNILVCICGHGWDISIELGQSGVCYFGNLGDKIFQYDSMIHYLAKNHNFLINGKRGVKGQFF